MAAVTPAIYPAAPGMMLHACMLSRFSRVRLYATPWPVASQVPLSMGSPRQEYWSGLPFPSPSFLYNFFLFFLFYSMAVISTSLSSNSLLYSYASALLLLIPSSIFLISVIILFISVCLFFSTSGKVKVLVAQSCLTLCDPIDCSLPGSYVHWITQATILERVAISFSRGSSWMRDWTWV